MQASSRDAGINVGAPVLSRTQDGRWRVAANVDGTEAFLTSDDELVANGDAWASAMLLPAAASESALSVDSDLDAQLNANFGRVQTRARDYWGFKGARVSARRLVERSPAGGQAMFFTCGVDSFYTLRRRQASLERLIFVRGLNINLVDLANEARFAPVREGIEAVARALGIRAVVAESNLRTHPTFSRVGWWNSHIAALAGVAHALAPVVSRVYVASDELPLPLGSDPTLDPLWSSAAVEIVNDGSEATRLDKVRAIADWPLVHRHLRVCYANRGNELNCGRCRKCVGTQLRFEIAGARDRLETFPRTPMLELIDGLPYIPKDIMSLWIDVQRHVDDPKLKAAIARLLGRQPSAVERLQEKALWLRKTAVGRRVRKLAKRMLVR
jgi:hypothetical protein